MIFRFLRNIGIQCKWRIRPLVSIRVVQTRRKLSLVRRNLKPTRFSGWVVHKLSSYNPVIGKQLRDMYERGILETEDDYISALKELQSSTVFEEREVVYGTKLVASRFGMKGCIGYMPSTHQELMTLYRELFWKCVREELDVGISVVKGDGYAEFRPCTIYSTYADFYDAIFHDLLRRPRQ